MKKLNIIKKICILFIFSAGLSQAGQYAVSLEKDRVVVGEKVNVSLIFLESGSGETVEFPVEIYCELISGGTKFAALAKKDQQQQGAGLMDTPTGAKQHYSLTLPSELQGQVIVSFNGVEAPRVVLDVVVPDSDAIATTDKVYSTLDSISTLYQPYLTNTSAYQPVYFLVGTDPENSKFQISFKYRFFDSDAAFVKSHQWLTGLHFGYTQTSFWDLKSSSAPFDDTSYKPELFWLSRNYLESEHGLLKGVFFQTGYQHESNGKDGDSSRSTNYLYIQPVLIFYDDDSKVGLALSPKIWSYIGNDDTTNADLADYRGYFDLEVKFGLAESFVADTHFRLADEGASFELDISYPLDKIFGDALDIYFYAQYSNVLAESLLDYEDRTQTFRLGLAFIR